MMNEENSTCVHNAYKTYTDLHRKTIPCAEGKYAEGFCQWSHLEKHMKAKL